MATTDPADDTDEDEKQPEQWPTPAATDLLPDAYDELVPIDQLVHGKHNPRRVPPTPALQRSVANHGLQRPLVVHQPEGADVYHITDGWQRYQAATSAGWTHLPVRIHETALAALGSAERESLSKNFTTYQWAKHCRAIAREIEASSRHERAQKVVAITDRARGVRTVKRYLRVLELPEPIHALLRDAPDGTEQDWQALQNRNPDVRQYGPLSWVVANQIAKGQDAVDDARLIGIAAWAVTFNDREQAEEFVRAAVETPGRRLDQVVRQTRSNGQLERRFVVPRVAVPVSSDEKDALMDELSSGTQSMSEVIIEHVQQLAAEACDDAGE